MKPRPHNTLHRELAEIDFKAKEEARNRLEIRKRAKRMKKNAAIKCIKSKLIGIICNN